MLETIETYAIAIPAQGPAGLAVPHLGRGEILEAIWIFPHGLRLRAQRGSTWVKVTQDQMAKHWAGEGFIQILETDPNKQDNCWLVPLTGAPVPSTSLGR